MKYISLILLLALISATSLTSNAAPTGHRDANKPHKAVKHPALKVLPKRHHRITHQGRPYYVHAGQWYHQTKGVFVAINAPIGAIISALPNGYITIGVGINRYFHFGGVFYKAISSGYVVIPEPVEATAIKENTAPGINKLIIYPAEGQSEQQKSRDKYECHEWARTDTGYDPTSAQSAPQLKFDYQRAMTACLEARKYVVK